jgi:ferrochelatase
MYLSEPPYRHGTPSRTGILLINLGTPEAPTAAAVRTYLKEFLSDPRVVEMPRALWWLILNGIILNTRPRKSAEKYAQIWTAEGSPLLVHTRRQAGLLKEALDIPAALSQHPQGVSPPGSRCYAATTARRERGQTAAPPRDGGTGSVLIEYAMRYGNPSISSALARLREQGCTRILAFPLYPQYSASATATAFDALFAALSQTRNMPEIRTVRSFHDHPAYIAALAANINEYWTAHGRPDKLLMSFHGVPRYTLDKGDPYHCECQKTGRLLAEALGLATSDYVLTFQSRFGRAEWLQPYTAATLEALGKQGTGKLDVVCPGFVGDCLETLEEIAMEGKAAFLNSGGKEFRYIPALNEHPQWIDALAAIAREHLAGWESHVNIADESTASRARALALGAKD